ncbi:MAG: ubiquinol-cytochrome C chaperone [Acetobacteraceae bacterium]|nr:ubiquinol-cytochrome C chaperone [Acetobacteraceae bacterium]
MGLASLFRRPPYERAGFHLYGAAVSAAREPRPYVEWGVPDTTAGRFELVSLHAALLIRRLNAEGGEPGKSLAQAVFDAMFSDMDVNLREMGVGDLGVGKRVKKLWEGFHGRARAYQEALDGGDDAALREALGRNVWAGHAPLEGAVEALAAHVHRVAGALAGQGMEAFVRGEAAFPAP